MCQTLQRKDGCNIHSKQTASNQGRCSRGRKRTLLKGLFSCLALCQPICNCIRNQKPAWHDRNALKSVRASCQHPAECPLRTMVHCACWLLAGKRIALTCSTCCLLNSERHISMACHVISVAMDGVESIWSLGRHPQQFHLQNVLYQARAMQQHHGKLLDKRLPIGQVAYQAKQNMYNMQRRLDVPLKIWLRQKDTKSMHGPTWIRQVALIRRSLTTSCCCSFADSSI